MKYVRQQITGFTYSSIPDLYPLWNKATTYNTEEVVSANSVARWGSYQFRTITDANVGNEPKTTDDGYWIPYAVSNRHAMIDLRSTTKSVAIGADIVVEFTRNYTMDTLIIGYYSAESIVIEHRSDADEILRTQTITQSANEDVEDYYTYIYSPYSIETGRSAVVDIYPIGTKIRVTFVSGVNIPDTSCGFLTCGESIDMGSTLANVNFKYTSYSTKNTDSFGIITIVRRAVQELVDFQTKILRATMPTKRRKIKVIYDEVLTFIVDDSGSDEQEGIVTLGTIEETRPGIDSKHYSYIGWSISEVI